MMNGKCPSCGYCEHCGRSDRAYPNGVLPSYPWWQGHWYGGGNVAIGADLVALFKEQAQTYSATGTQIVTGDKSLGMK